MSITPPGQSGASANTNPGAPKNSVQPKKKNFLSFLCCGVPDHANGGDQQEGPMPANKISKVGSDHPTTAARPDNTGSGQQINTTAPFPTEKDALKQAEPGHDRDETTADSGRTLQSGASSGANGELSRPGDARDQPLPDLPKEAGPSTAGQANPSVVVQAPARPDPVPAQTEKDGDGDVRMGDPDPLPSEKEEAPVPPRREETAKPTLPPPPPVPQPGPSEETPAPDTTEGKQSWLLPPIAPRFKGKKCLVLDLDETLVHSSFKVSGLEIPLNSLANLF